MTAPGRLLVRPAEREGAIQLAMRQLGWPRVKAERAADELYRVVEVHQRPPAVGS